MARLRTAARITLVYLLLGFVTTWAVAWACALLPPTPDVSSSVYPDPVGPLGSPLVVVQSYQSLGGMRVTFESSIHSNSPSSSHSLAYVFTSPLLPSPSLSLWSSSSLCWSPSGFDGWGRRREAIAAGPDWAWSIGVEDGLGFPAIALWCSWTGWDEVGTPTPANAWEPEGGIRIHDVGRATSG